MNMNTPPAVAPTALDICNLALSKLGESPIAGIDANGNPAARLCYMHYHPARREALCANRWSFATVLADLHSAEAGSETGIPSLPHTLPSDCLRVLETDSHGWTMRGRCIFCPEQDIRILYIADIEDTSLFEPLFIEAFAALLACKLCIPLTSSTTARQALTDEYRRIALPRAAHFNGVQSHSNDTHPLYELWRNALSNPSHCE